MTCLKFSQNCVRKKLSRAFVVVVVVVQEEHSRAGKVTQQIKKTQDDLSFIPGTPGRKKSQLP